MTALPACPKCNSELTYQDGQVYVCPECAHEWEPSSTSAAAYVDVNEPELVVRDANGNLLRDGDAVIVIKDLPVSRASAALAAT